MIFILYLKFNYINMKELIRYSGLFIIFIGIVVLIASFLKGITGNTGLITAAFLVVLGFIIYLITNRYYE